MRGQYPWGLREGALNSVYLEISARDTSVGWVDRFCHSEQLYGNKGRVTARRSFAMGQTLRWIAPEQRARGKDEKLQ